MAKEENEVKMRVIQMAKKPMKAASMLKALKEEFPNVGVRKLVEWVDDIIGA